MALIDMELLNPERIRTLVQSNTHPDSMGDRYKKAAVYMLLHNLEDTPAITAILKSNNKGYPWANQVALPGGMVDPSDPTPHDAALREVEEELNIHSRHVDSFGSLGHFITINSTEIEAFAGVWDASGTIRYDRSEIAQVLTLPLSDLVATHREKRFCGRIPDYSELMYPVDNVVVWGATARILHYFLELVFSEETAVLFSGKAF